MKYLPIIRSVIERLDYSAKVEKSKGRRSIRVYFSEDVAFLTQNLLSSLMSIKGLYLIAVNFDTRSVSFIY